MTSNMKIKDKFLPYQHQWKDKFNKEKNLLKEVFQEESVLIEHIGSTSIEGLSAKPIIDIAVLVNSIGGMDNLDLYKSKIESLGYECQQEMSSGERIFFRKGDPIEYHLSITSKRFDFWDRNIIFRDYLRNNFDAMKEYQRLKEDNLKNTPTEDFYDLSHSKTYNKGKSDFVKKILELAKDSS